MFTTGSKRDIFKCDCQSLTAEEKDQLMPIIKSAKKRVRAARKATVRNVKTKRTLRTALKQFHAAVTGKSKNAAEAHAKAQSALDTAAKKGLMHKNKLARRKRQLAQKAKAAGTRTVSTAAKKTAGKKAPIKKTGAKSAAKKTTAARKPVSKKSAKK